jgi:hypothetical protein
MKSHTDRLITVNNDDRLVAIIDNGREALVTTVVDAALILKAIEPDSKRTGHFLRMIRGHAFRSYDVKSLIC